MSKLISISENGFESYNGHYVSYCFCQFSHFMYMEGEYKKAIEFAERAMAADNTEGEPHYLLGFYDLFVNEKDPLYHFKEAVKRDPSFLNRIVNHPSIKEFPGIINELRSLEVIDFTEGSNLCFLAPSKVRIVGIRPIRRLKFDSVTQWVIAHSK